MSWTDIKRSIIADVEKEEQRRRDEKRRKEEIKRQRRRAHAEAERRAQAMEWERQRRIQTERMKIKQIQEEYRRAVNKSEGLAQKAFITYKAKREKLFETLYGGMSKKEEALARAISTAC